MIALAFLKNIGESGTEILFGNVAIFKLPDLERDVIDELVVDFPDDERDVIPHCVESGLAVQVSVQKAGEPTRLGHLVPANS